MSYKTRAAFSEGDWDQSVTADEIFDRTTQARWTGLYDQYGERLIFVPDRVEFGFQGKASG